MLEHQMTVLQAVEDNHNLFEKELKKSLKWLSLEEKNQLQEWLEKRYQQRYPELIENAFMNEKEFN
jgi:hypothetical protein